VTQPFNDEQRRLLARIFHAVHLRRQEEAERQQDELVEVEIAEAKRRVTPPARYSTRDQT